MANLNKNSGLMVDRRNASRITSSRSLRRATLSLTGWWLLPPTELIGDLLVVVVVELPQTPVDDLRSARAVRERRTS